MEIDAFSLQTLIVVTFLSDLLDGMMTVDLIAWSLGLSLKGTDRTLKQSSPSMLS